MKECLILIGVATATLGLRGYLLPIDPIVGWLIVLDAPFIVLVYVNHGKQLALRTDVAISLLAASVAVTPSDLITSDKSLDAIFGGISLELGTSLAIRGGAVLDGTEILAGISRITIYDIVLFTFAAFILSVEVALFAITTHATA